MHFKAVILFSFAVLSFLFQISFMVIPTRSKVRRKDLYLKRIFVI